MESLFQELTRLLEAGQPVVLATVVATSGSTPQKPGAKLLVRSDGSTLGTLGGGCIEAEAWQKATEVMAGETALCSFTLSEDLAADSGLLCGGTMTILIDPWRREDLLLAREVALALAGGPKVALVTLVRGKAGAKLLLREDGSRAGGLGASTLEDKAISFAFSSKSPSLITLDTEYDAFLEPFLSPATLLIAGAGHIAQALATLAGLLGFRVVVADDRADFASQERFPQAHALLVGDIEASIRSYSGADNTFVVVATRGHKQDYQAMRTAAGTKARYLGLVGSRRKVLLIFRQLIQEGVPLERLKDIYAPVGLNLGARTPYEIALSILSEIVMVQHGKDGRPLRLKAETRLRPGKPS
ncbi:MAG: XdhC family protein [Chloroflexi bacterium]|nr:XdhC family protein [Chloroflexota bacterium]